MEIATLRLRGHCSVGVLAICVGRKGYSKLQDHLGGGEVLIVCGGAVADKHRRIEGLVGGCT